MRIQTSAMFEVGENLELVLPEVGPVSFTIVRVIVPLRITARADWQPVEGLGVGFQINHYGASSYFTPTQEDFGLAESDAVTLASANISYDLGPVSIYAAADNLFDEVYVNPAAQVDGFDFFNYEAPGRRVPLGVRGRF